MTLIVFTRNIILRTIYTGLAVILHYIMPQASNRFDYLVLTYK